jgi:hypothetical protein
VRTGVDALHRFAGHGQVGDRRVLGLAGAVAHHAAVPVPVREVDGVERLGQRADLVDLHQKRVGALLADPAGQPLGIRDEQVVTDDLDPPAEHGGDPGPTGPVFLVERVLDRDDRVVRDELLVVCLLYT